MRTAEMCSCTDSGIVVLLFLPGLTTIPAVRTNGRTAGEPPVTDSSWRVHARAINASNAERRRRRAERSVGWRECAASERAAPAQSAPAAAAARARSGRNAPQKLTSGCGMSSSSIVRELQAVEASTALCCDGGPLQSATGAGGRLVIDLNRSCRSQSGRGNCVLQARSPWPLLRLRHPPPPLPTVPHNHKQHLAMLKILSFAALAAVVKGGAVELTASNFDAETAGACAHVLSPTSLLRRDGGTEKPAGSPQRARPTPRTRECPADAATRCVSVAQARVLSLSSLLLGEATANR